MLLGGRNVILRTSCLFIRAFFSIRFVGLTNYISLIKGTSRLEIVGGHRNAFFAFLFPCICLENYHILLIKEQVGRCQKTQECNLLALFNYFCICLNSNHIFFYKRSKQDCRRTQECNQRRENLGSGRNCPLPPFPAPTVPTYHSKFSLFAMRRIELMAIFHS